jgi:pyrroloquinoline quinone (PQQ) biosynthesis protein C
MARLANGGVSVVHYAAYLRETYFYSREDPQIQAAATAYFRGVDRAMVEPFLQHAKSEVGHDALALNDLATLGFEVSSIPEEAPLPATELLISYPYWAMSHKSPAAYLGYLFFLEFLPTSQGGGLTQALVRLGVPSAAMTFLQEHQSVDVHHNRLMKLYANHMIRTPEVLAEVVGAMASTARAFRGMLEEAFETVDAKTATLAPAARSGSELLQA